MIAGIRVPHPIPYQGSKRRITDRILSYFPNQKVRLFEPFAGSAAVSIAAAANGMVSSIILNDDNEPLMNLWNRIIHQPLKVLRTYTQLWNEQLGNERTYYDQVRNNFNRTYNPDLLLYLLARCVKASVRYNYNGEFNQSPDNRRKGVKPETMAKHIIGASQLLCNITILQRGDYRDSISQATPEDIVYLDPPYQGVCRSRDCRYLNGLSLEEFIDSLYEMNTRGLSYIISYDGRTGEKTYGDSLPDDLHLKHIEIKAGVSSQATLLGRRMQTIESLYLSSALQNRIGYDRIINNLIIQQSQLSFL